MEEGGEKMLIPLKSFYKVLEFDRYKLTFTKEEIEEGRDVIDFKRLGKFWVDFLVIDVNKEGKVEGFEAWGVLFGVFNSESLVIPFKLPGVIFLEDIERGLITAGELLQMGLNWLEHLAKEGDYGQ